jgi:hypothetical protein
MSARRRSLSEFIPAAPDESPALPDHPAAAETPGPAAPAEQETGTAGRPQRPSRAGRAAKAPPAAQQPDRPTARALVPADLALLQRLHRRRLDTGMDIRDQVAIAVDEWLTSEGY